MREEEKKPNPPIYIPAVLVEDILLRLPLKKFLKFKTVSKEWKSIVESKRFAERRKSVQKNTKILVFDGASVVQGDAEIDIVYLNHVNVTTTQPSLTCDGLVCIFLPYFIDVLNPTTGEFLRFPSAGSLHRNIEPGELFRVPWDPLRWCRCCRWDLFPEYRAMGFGRDEVTGNYKVVNMLYNFNIFEILDLHIGEWRKLSPPPYKIEAVRKSACVNGSIYWLDFKHSYKILALDLHTEKFRDLPVVPPWPDTYSDTAKLVNLEDRLAMAYTCYSVDEVKLKIWSMDAQEETWTMTYSIILDDSDISSACWFTPMAVSKQGNLFLCDSYRRLLKYNPETDNLSCLSPHDSVVTSFVENLVPIRLQGGGCVPKTSRCKTSSDTV